MSNKHGIYMEQIKLQFVLLKIITQLVAKYPLFSGKIKIMSTLLVQYSQVIKFRLFFIFTHIVPLRERPLWVSQQMDIFSSSSNSFQPLTFCSYLAEKNTSFIPTRDPWPTRHDLTSSPSYVITSVCDSFSDRISNLICIVVNVLRPGHSHVYSHGR